MFIGTRLKTLRKINRMTQEQLGEKLGVTKVSVCCYENDIRTPSLETLSEISNIFGVSTDYLLGKDIPVIMDGVLEYGATVSNEELEFIKELRNYKELHKKIIKEPKRMLELIDMKLKKSK